MLSDEESTWSSNGSNVCPASPIGLLAGADVGLGEQNMMYENEFNSRSPAAEASSDPAPTQHEPQTEDQRVREKSKYEASEVFRSPKGDRFS
jgi:hypothetical protein